MNKSSTLEREWILAHDPSLPVDIVVNAGEDEAAGEECQFDSGTGPMVAETFGSEIGTTWTEVEMDVTVVGTARLVVESRFP